MNEQTQVTVGDFIRIPAWRVEGMVTTIEPADSGSGTAIAFWLQEYPDGPERRYRLEPNEYLVIG